MMRVLQVLFALLLTVPLAFLGWLLAKDPGRLNVRAWGWQIETTLVLALALLLLAVLAIALLYLLLWQLPKHFYQRRQRYLQAQFQGGLLDYFAGRFARAKKRLTSAIAHPHPQQRGIAQLAAGISANWVDDNQHAQSLFAQAAQAPELADIAPWYALQAKLDAGDLGALAQMKTLAAAAPTALNVTGVLVALHARQRGEEAITWIQAGRGNPVFKAACENSRVAALMADLHRAALGQASTAEALQTLWQGLSHTEKTQVDLIALYCTSAERLGRSDWASAALWPALKHQSSEQLWHVAASLKSVNVDADQLKFAERSLSQQGESPSLLLALAHLCMAQKLTGKAEQYLQSALRLAPSASAHALAAELATSAGDMAGANRHYQAAIALLPLGS
jgi:HemY protein